MILIPKPLVEPEPPDLAKRIEAKIAAMLAMPSTEPQPKKPARFRNGMEALAKWEQEADAATDKF